MRRKIGGSSSRAKSGTQWEISFVECVGKTPRSLPIEPYEGPGVMTKAFLGMQLLWSLGANFTEEDDHRNCIIADEGEEAAFPPHACDAPALPGAHGPPAPGRKTQGPLDHAKLMLFEHDLIPCRMI